MNNNKTKNDSIIKNDDNNNYNKDNENMNNNDNNENANINNNDNSKTNKNPNLNNKVTLKIKKNINPKLNSSLDKKNSNKKGQNINGSNIKSKRNTMNSLLFPKKNNITNNPSLQNSNNIKSKNDEIESYENKDDSPLLLEILQNSVNSEIIDYNNNKINISNGQNNLNNIKVERKYSKNSEDVNISNNNSKIIGENNIVKNEKEKEGGELKEEKSNENEKEKEINKSKEEKISENEEEKEKEKEREISKSKEDKRIKNEKEKEKEKEKEINKSKEEKISENEKEKEREINKSKEEKSNEKEKEREINKSKEEKRIKDENNYKEVEEEKRLNTEEYLENNIESQHTPIKDQSQEKNDSIIKKNDINKSSEFSENNESESYNKEIILTRPIIGNNYINKIRQKNFKLNSKIPKKKRVFISKIITINNIKEKEQILLPIATKCLMTNTYLILNKNKLFKTITNKYFFKTKLTLQKDNEITETKKSKESEIIKFPKVYKKTIISPNKIGLLQNKSKQGNTTPIKSDDIKNKNNSNNKNNAENRVKRIKEKISLISKNKVPTKFSLSQLNNKGGNIIIKHNDKILKKLEKSNEGNKIDISIQFSNKAPLDLGNSKKAKKFPSSAKKKYKNLSENLYKDLREINEKIENNEGYYKKHHFNMDYDRHVGDEKTCPICRKVRRRGRKLEREKGLFSAFSLRHLQNLNRRSLPKLNIVIPQKEKETDFKNNYERKELDKLFSMNNLDMDFKNKYMKFNGMNINKLNRYGSSQNFKSDLGYENIPSFRNTYLNIDKEMEKNEEELDRIRYPALSNYFHD